MTDKPLLIAEIERIAGYEAAAKLSRAKGGQTIYVPAFAKEGHWLTELVGLEAAAKICDHYRVMQRGAPLLVPIAKIATQRRAMIEALEAGASASQAAEKAGMHERSAFRQRKRIRDERQGKLF